MNKLVLLTLGFTLCACSTAQTPAQQQEDTSNDCNKTECCGEGCKCSSECKCKG